MSVITVLAQLVEEAGLGYSHSNGNLFEQIELPHTPHRAVRIKGYSGEDPGYTHNQQGPAYMYPRAQIMVRGEPEEYYVPEQDVMALYFHLGRSRPVLIEGHRLLGVDPLGYPEYLQRDTHYRVSYVFNVRIEEGRNG